jgi:hypothetical protein
MPTSIVDRALDMLELGAHDVFLDLGCGLGKVGTDCLACGRGYPNACFTLVHGPGDARCSRNAYDLRRRSRLCALAPVAFLQLISTTASSNWRGRRARAHARTHARTHDQCHSPSPSDPPRFEQESRRALTADHLQRIEFRCADALKARRTHRSGRACRWLLCSRWIAVRQPAIVATSSRTITPDDALQHTTGSAHRKAPRAAHAARCVQTRPTLMPLTPNQH